MMVVQDWFDKGGRIKNIIARQLLLDFYDIFGGIRFAIETLEMNHAALDVDKLVAYTLGYDVGSVIKRTGWKLEAIGINRRFLEPLQKYPVQNYYPLDTQQARGGTPDARWCIMQNLAGGETNDGS